MNDKNTYTFIVFFYSKNDSTIVGTNHYILQYY